MKAMRRRRRRERDGYGTFTIETKVARLALALAEEGFLCEWNDGDKSEIAAAFQKMVESWVTVTIGPDDVVTS